MKKVGFLIAMFLLFPVIFICGCAGYKIHQVQVNPPETYSASAGDNALTVAANPLDTEAEVRAVFNTDLNRANIIVRNNGSEPFSLERNAIFLVDSRGVQVLPTTAEMMIQSAGTSIAKWYFISGILGGLSADRARKKMKEDFINKELKNQLVPGGVTVYGFLYFQHKVGPTGASGYKIIVANSPAGTPLEVLIR
jgi:hypothetical protein